MIGFSFKTNTSNCSVTWIFKQFISGLMRYLNLHKAVNKPYLYNLLLKHLTSTYRAINYRLNHATSKHDKHTKTYFRFHHNSRTVYIGIAKLCTAKNSDIDQSSCNLPTAFICQKSIFCPLHRTQQIRSNTPVPPKSERLKRSTHHKDVYSTRTGSTYRKTYYFNNKHEYRIRTNPISIAQDHHASTSKMATTQGKIAYPHTCHMNNYQ
jgi:hypothetical protein